MSFERFFKHMQKSLKEGGFLDLTPLLQTDSFVFGKFADFSHGLQA